MWPRVSEPLAVTPVLCRDCVPNPHGGVALCLAHAVAQEALLELDRLLTIFLETVLSPMERATGRGDVIRAARDTVRAGLGRPAAPASANLAANGTGTPSLPSNGHGTVDRLLGERGDSARGDRQLVIP
jgi:hypothetical protein